VTALQGESWRRDRRPPGRRWPPSTRRDRLPTVTRLVAAAVLPSRSRARPGRHTLLSGQPSSIRGGIRVAVTVVVTVALAPSPSRRDRHTFAEARGRHLVAATVPSSTRVCCRSNRRRKRHPLDRARVSRRGREPCLGRGRCPFHAAIARPCRDRPPISPGPVLGEQSRVPPGPPGQAAELKKWPVSPVPVALPSTGAMGTCHPCQSRQFWPVSRGRAAAAAAVMLQQQR
jgi:hypothetical protein